MKNVQYKTIDDYLAQLPEDQLVALEQIRQLVRDLVPQVEEAISYGIPIFKFHGHLVGFGAFKQHLTFFTCKGDTLGQFKTELTGYKLAQSGIHFTPDKPISADLLTRIIHLRATENAEKAAAKRKQ